jgi:glycosyltransferase involved in cell wall biosynthesis
MPSVSAIIPTFNRARCIGRAIDSVLAQTLEDIEVIVVDDGSTDDTAAVVAGFGEKVRYFNQQNAGQGVARNLGVKSARAPWVAFLDSDDVWVEQKLERQLRISGELEADLTFTDFSLRKDLDGEGFDSWKAELQRLGMRQGLTPGLCPDPIHFIIAPGDIAFTSTLMIRREVFLRSGGFHPQFRRCQDFELYLRLISTCGASFGFIDEILARREMAQNATKEITYAFRIKALAGELKRARANQRHGDASALRRAILRESRALAGVLRRTGRPGPALAAIAKGMSFCCGFGKNFKDLDEQSLETLL